MTGSMSLQSSSFIQLPMRFKATSSEPSQMATASSDMFELGTQLNRQADINRNIKEFKQTIVEKQKEGRKLALNIADPRVELEEHLASK